MTKRQPNLPDIKSAISEQWKNVPAGAAAVHFISCIEAQEAPPAEWTWPDILGVFGNSATPPEILAAMAILSQSEWAIFRACAVFVDEKEECHRLSGEEFQRVQTEDTLTHPTTGATVTKAAARVVPFFELIPGVFAPTQANPQLQHGGEPHDQH